MKNDENNQSSFSIGKRIKELREEMGFTTNNLAYRAGISQSYLREVEQNDKNPTIEFLYLICQPLGVSLKEFFKDEHSTDVPDQELIQKIRRLNDEQRTSLLKFIESME